MTRLDPWQQFQRAIASWQAAHPAGSIGLSPDPLDYGRTPEAAVVLQWHEEGVCGGSCQFCFVPPRCPSKPPPFKYETQQCDQPFGHAGPHWFDDGWFRHKWTESHMEWCGLDTDHEGMCHPPRPWETEGEKGQPEAEPEAPPEAPEASPEALLRQGAVIVLKEILRAVETLLEEIE